MNKKIGMIGLAALLLLGIAGNVFAKEDGVPKDESGKLYAGTGKDYVSEDVLSVGFQTTSPSDSSEPATAALRMVTTVNDTCYKKVGFKIQISDKDGGSLRSRVVESNRVYSRIKAADGSDNPAYYKTPQAFCEESKYFATYTITNIPQSVFRNTYFTVTPYWVTEDGITVYGVTRSVMVGDTYDGIVSVPIRLNSDVDTAAGSVEVTYPAETMTYKGYFNSGDVYEEMSVDDKTSGKIKCVGNVADISKNKKADGMYVSLRFQVAQAANAAALPEAEVSIGKTMFCDNKEAVVQVPTVQAKYYTFQEPASLRVLSFNLRMDFTQNDDGLLSDVSRNRIQAVQEQVLSYEPDLIGFQEDVQNWVDNLTIDEKDYTRYLPDEEMTSKTAEYCSIYVKHGIKVLDSGWQWLTSDKTGDTVALTYKKLTENGGEFYFTFEELFSLGIYGDAYLKTSYTDSDTETSYGNKLDPRLMNWVMIEQDGRTICYVNTHLQHRGYNGKSYDDHPLYKLRYYERKAQFQLLQEKVKELQAQYPDTDVVITGDFNDTQDSGFYTYVSGFYSDSKRVAKNDTSPENTWNSAYQNDKQGQGYNSSQEGTIVNRIDFCFVSEELAEQVGTYQVGKCYWVLKQAIATQEKNIKVYPSDHLPVIVDLHLRKEIAPIYN